MPSFNSYANSEQIKRELFIPAKAQLESWILVKIPLNEPIRVPRRCLFGKVRYNYYGEFGCSRGCSPITTCVTYQIPEFLLQRCKMMSASGIITYTGVDSLGAPNSDVVLLVSAENCDPGILAFAGSCFLEGELDRPIVGVLTICRGMINAGQSIKSNIATVQHEIIHALGFSSDKFALYRNQDGTPIVPRNANNLPNLGFNNTIRAFTWTDNIAKEFVRRRSNIHETYTKRVFAITLPTVLQEARNYFNCPTLDGVDLQGYPILSHFSEYLLNYELMTPFSNGPMDTISRFTLALLKDTGWYDVNMSALDDFSYSKNSGCTPIFDGCYTYMNEQRRKGLSLLPFCDKVFTSGHIYNCMQNRKFFYFCYLFKQDIPRMYQYFTELKGIPDWDAYKYGGISVHREYCPSIRILGRPNSLCTDTDNIGLRDNMNVLDSYYGKDSLCFENNVVRSTPSALYGASCQKYAFNAQTKTLTVFFKSKTVYCPSNETFLIQGSRGYTATFTCPSLDDFVSMGSIMMAMDRINKLFYFAISIWKCIDLF